MPVTAAISSFLGRLPEERVGDGRHRGTRIGDDDLRDVEVEPALDDERDGAVLDRLRREVVPVDPLSDDGEEQRSGRRMPGVEGEVENLDRASCMHLDDVVGDEPLQVHRGAI